MKKGTKLYSVLHFKCPRCNEGDLFSNKNPYKLSGFFSMPLKCAACGQKYELETGFFYGSMYISYGLTIAMGIALWLVIGLFTEMPWFTFLLIDIAAMLLVIPIVFRLSRAIWINLFVHYEPGAGKLNLEKND